MNFISGVISFFLSAVFFVSSFLGVTPKNIPKNIELEKLNYEEKITVGNFDFYYDADGFSVAYKGTTMLEEASACYTVDGITVYSDDYDNYDISQLDVSDVRGNGKKITVRLTDEEYHTLIQYFVFYSDTDYFLTSAEIESTDGIISTNYIAPVVITDGKIQNGSPEWNYFLQVPFSNDDYSEYEPVSILRNGESYEVGAFFTPDEGAGFVIGSVTHNTWKTGISYKSSGYSVRELYAYCGAISEKSGDDAPHGSISGYNLSSAIIMLGFYDNWKDGMNEFADVNLTYAGRRKAVIDSNPIGWNSWGSVQKNLNHSVATETSDYIKENFQDVWCEDENDVVYINLDSYWDNLSSEELYDFVAHCKENGQTAGVYFAPFVTWYSESELDDNYVCDTEYTFGDIVLKKSEDDRYSAIDGCYPLDVTHPATKTYFRTKLKELMSYGFKYIKLDFLGHGALEGEFYNEDIQTGIQAYNYAMKEVCSVIGSDVFINMSISPIFPYWYANGRRLCCDTYSDIKETKYMMNSLTYGFWTDRLYDYIDPDHIVLWDKEGKTTYNEAKSRLLSGIVTGGSFLAGDNFIRPFADKYEASDRFNELLKNKELLSLLRTEESFTARLSDVPSYASRVFYLENEDGMYIAVFNYNRFMLSFNAVDVPEGYVAVDILSSKVRTYGKDKMVVALQPSDCAMYKLLTKEEYELMLTAEDEALTEALSE